MGEKIIKTLIDNGWAGTDKPPRYRRETVEQFIDNAVFGHGIEEIIHNSKEITARLIGALHKNGVLSDIDVFDIAGVPDYLQNSDEGSSFVEAKD